MSFVGFLPKSCVLQMYALLNLNWCFLATGNSKTGCFDDVFHELFNLLNLAEPLFCSVQTVPLLFPKNVVFLFLTECYVRQCGTALSRGCHRASVSLPRPTGFGWIWLWWLNFILGGGCSIQEKITCLWVNYWNLFARSTLRERLACRRLVGLNTKPKLTKFRITIMRRICYS